MRATAHAVFSPWGLTRLAEAYGQAEQPAAALRVVAEALTVVVTPRNGCGKQSCIASKGRCWAPRRRTAAWAPKPPTTKR